MNTTRALTLVVLVLSAGCGSKASVERSDIGGIASSGSRSQAPPPPPSASFVNAEPPPASMRVGGAAFGGGGGEPVGDSVRPGPSQPVDPVSYLAYAYGISVELPVDRLIGVMEGHVAACRSAGPRVCQLVTSTRQGYPQESLHGSLSLRGEPRWLDAFMKGVQSDTVGAAGRVIMQSTVTDDLTREIVDTEATLRARRTLRDRLQQLLATRPGSLADLLGVERELARVQGEIDSTESTLAAMRTRVAMSLLTIDYQSSARVTARATFAPLREAFGDFVVAVVESTAKLVVMVGALIPWAIAGVLGVWLLVRARRRRITRAASPGSTPAPS